MRKAMRIVLTVLCIMVVAVVLFIVYKRATSHDSINPPVNLKVTSSAFVDGGMMPQKYTGRGEDLSPPLKLDAVSPEARTIAVIMDDIDTPLGIYNHWVIWNIAASFGSIPEGVPKGETVSSLGNAVQGRSEYGFKHWYRGPLPPFGTHRYVFKVYVLDTELDLSRNAGKEELQKAMVGHVIQFGTITGKFGGKGD